MAGLYYAVPFILLSASASMIYFASASKKDDTDIKTSKEGSSSSLFSPKSQAPLRQPQAPLRQPQAPPRQPQAPPRQQQAPPRQPQAPPRQPQAPTRQSQAPTRQPQPSEDIYLFTYGTLNPTVMSELLSRSIQHLYSAKLTGWQRVFINGNANIVESRDAFVVGLVYKINNTDLTILRRYENFPNMYIEKELNPGILQKRSSSQSQYNTNIQDKVKCFVMNQAYMNASNAFLDPSDDTIKKILETLRVARRPNDSSKYKLDIYDKNLQKVRNPLIYKYEQGRFTLTNTSNAPTRSNINQSTYILGYGSLHQKEFEARLGRSVIPHPAILKGWKRIFCGFGSTRQCSVASIIKDASSEVECMIYEIQNITAEEFKKIQDSEGYIPARNVYAYYQYAFCPTQNCRLKEGTEKVVGEKLLWGSNNRVCNEIVYCYIKKLSEDKNRKFCFKNYIGTGNTKKLYAQIYVEAVAQTIKESRKLRNIVSNTIDVDVFDFNNSKVGQVKFHGEQSILQTRNINGRTDGFAVPKIIGGFPQNLVRDYPQPCGP
jgi:gamma-glutamylcyclotransferase (GGCT)/AIG2-like uncharacterized protein YtfP